MAPLPSTYAIEAETASLSVRDGQRSLNRWIRRGSVVLVTGDRPRFELQKLLPQHQMSSIVHRLAGGRLNIEANGTRAWFDDVPAIDTRFQPHATRWQAKCNGLEVSLRIGQAADWGAAIELRLCNVTAKDLQSKAVLVLDVRPPAAGEAVPEFRAAVTGQQAVITSGGVDFEAFIQADQGIRLREENGELHLELAAELGPEAAAGGWIVIGQRPAGDAGSPGSPETGSPEALLAESEAYYADRLAKVSCQTPSAALNSALATAVVNMEYLYASPAWLEGVQGWSAYWNNNYQIQAALDLGQAQRARAALAFTGGRERGPCPTLYADGEPIEKWCGDIKSVHDDEDGLPYWLLQLSRYVEHTGDLAFAEGLWEKIERAIDYCWAARDQVGNGLLSWHSGCNTFMYQADALGMSGEAASPSLMMAGMLERLAVLADRLNRAEAATSWRAKAQAMHKAMLERLWQTDDGCFCNHRDLQDIVHRAHYYTDLVFPTLYTGLPGVIGWQSLLRAVRELWIALDAERGLLRVGNLKPDGFGNNNPMPTQMAEAARAFFRAGLRSRGMLLLETVARAATTDTDAPGNFPERVSEEGWGLNHYVFGNPVGSFAIAVVEGLFGLTVEDEGKTLHGRPAFPDEWETARLRTPYASIEFERQADGDGRAAVYAFSQDAPRALQFDAILPPCRVSAVTVDDRDVEFSCSALLGSTRVSAVSRDARQHVVKVTYRPYATAVSGPEKAPPGETVRWVCEQEVHHVEDPQGVLQELEVCGKTLHARLGRAGAHCFFVYYRDVSTVTPVVIDVEAAALRETPPVDQARAMLGAPVEMLDVSSSRNAAQILWMTQFGNRRHDIDRSALSGASPELQTPAGPFPLPEGGPLLVELVYGMSEKYSRALRRGDCPHEVRIPVHRRVAGLWLLYLCDVEVRHTGCEVGSVTLERGGERNRRMPLVMGDHVDTALPAAPGLGIPDRHYACETIPVPLAAGGHANLLWVALPAPAMVNECRVVIATADVWLGLLGVAAVTAAGEGG